MNDKSNSLGIFTEEVTNLMCPGCEAELDVSEFQVFEEISCPVCGEAITVPGRLGDFILIEELGRGAMGCVYLAMDESLNRLVALKVIRKEYGEDPKMLENVQREAQAMATLNHRNIVQVYSFGRIREQPFFVMELLQGERLDEMMAGGQQISEIRALEIAMDVAHGLDAANHAGLTHGDIKPANILMNDKGVAKVVDFGLAKFMEPGQEIEVWGTPYYIAPEKAKKKGEDSRSDQYSLGGTIFHALAGHPPFDAESPTKVVVAALKQETPLLRESNPEVTEKTEQVIRRMMEKNPSRRYPTYASLLADLELAYREAKAAEEARQLEEQRRLEKENKKTNPLVVTMLVVTAVVIAGIVGVVAFTSRGGGGEEVQRYEGPAREEQQPFLRAETRNFTEAVQAIRAGNLTQAEENLEVVYRLIPEQHVAMAWAKFLEAGIRLYAQYPDQARTLLEEVAATEELIFDTRGTPDEDPRILAEVALGERDIRDLQRSARKAQPYFAHLGELALGYQQMLADEPSNAARHFRAYAEMRTPGLSWPYLLHPLARQLHLPREQLVSEEVKQEERQELANQILSGLGTQSQEGKPLFKVSLVQIGSKPDFSNVKEPQWKPSRVEAEAARIPSKNILTNAAGLQPLSGRSFAIVTEVTLPRNESRTPGTSLVLVQFGGVKTVSDPADIPFGLVVEVSPVSPLAASVRIRGGTGDKQTLLQSLPAEGLSEGGTHVFAVSWKGTEGANASEFVVALDGKVIGSLRVDPSLLPEARDLTVVSLGSGIGNEGELTWGGGALMKRMYVYDRALNRDQLTTLAKEIP